MTLSSVSTDDAIVNIRWFEHQRVRSGRPCDALRISARRYRMGAAGVASDRPDTVAQPVERSFTQSSLDIVFTDCVRCVKVPV